MLQDKRRISFASRETSSYGIEERSRAATSAARELQRTSWPDQDPLGPGVSKPALPERLSVQEQLPPDILVSQQNRAEWVNVEYSRDEEEDLYRFLKGGLMAK